MRALMAGLILGAVMVAAVAWDALRAVRSPLDPPTTPTVLTLAPGTGWHALVAQLEREGWLSHPRDALYLRAYGRMLPESRNMKAGEYRIREPLSPRALLDLLISGDVIEYALTLIEGWRLRDALAAIRGHDAIAQSLPPDDAAATARIAEMLDIDAESPEGWLLPETYHFPRGTSDVELLKRAHTAMRGALEEAWAARRDALPLADPYELLIMASIVEKETGAPEERGRVAGVFTRRLERGMRLQTDPTVLYGRDPARSGRLLRRDLTTDTPYNTYTRHGLPPTPICLPGRASLRAAAQPADGSALYFVSRNDGTHKFSDTLAEHNRAVDRFQRGLP